MRLTLTRSAILTAGLFLAAAPAVAHAQGSIGGGSLPSSGSYVQSGSLENLWEANRFKRTFTQQEIIECWEEAHSSGISTGIRPCPLRPITVVDLALGRLLFGSSG
ncbi:hypothetical protein M2284_002771 [Rhodococcus sp. LBL1]|nr:hypothetical protein [Rhodococcus sp. LBL1]MDH6684564.1 hypothetical protein [Rhodococcus sp. LBL2]